MTAVRPELARPAGRVAEFSGPAPGTGAGPGEGVTVSSLAGTDLATLRPVVTWRTGIQAVITRGAGPTVTAPRGRVAGLRAVTGGTELLTVEPEGPRGAGLLTLGSGVAGLAPTLPGGGVTGGGRQSTLTVQTTVLTPPSLATDGVAGLSPPAVFTLTPPRDVVTALAVLLHTVAPVLAVQAVAPRPALQLAVDPLEPGQTLTLAPPVAGPLVLAGTFLLTVLSKLTLRTRSLAVGSRPGGRTRTLKHHGGLTSSDLTLSSQSSPCRRPGRTRPGWHRDTAGRSPSREIPGDTAGRTSLPATPGHSHRILSQHRTRRHSGPEVHFYFLSLIFIIMSTKTRCQD